MTAGLGSTSLVLSFKNNGAIAANQAYASVTGTGLSVTPTSCGTQASPVSVAAGATCSVTVKYAPTVAGTLTGGTVKVNSTAINSPATLALSGVATANGFLYTGGVYWVYAGTGVTDYAGANAACAAGTWGGVSSWRLAAKTDFDNLIANGYGGTTYFTAAGWPNGSTAGTAGRYWTTTQYQTTANVWTYTSSNNGFSNSATTAGYLANNTLCVHN